MEPKGLMIGDWISYRGIFNRIAPADFDSDHKIWMEEIKPIPLTPEILEKNGFIKKEHRWILLDSYTKDKLIVLLNAANCFALLTKEGMTLAFKYVHELQHFYRLCGIHKEIEI